MSAALGSKRPLDDDDSSDDDVGPAAPATLAVPAVSSDVDAHEQQHIDGGGSAGHPAKKRIAHVPNEQSYLDALPRAQMYEKSYMHRDDVTHAVWTPNTDFLVTGSKDGILKFWKKQPNCIEFTKAFRAHLSAIVTIVVSSDGSRLATVGEDCTIKYFDVVNFDMTEMSRLPFAPAAACWCYSGGASKPYLAVSDRHSSAIHLFNADKATEAAEHLVKLHTSPVLAMSYCAVKDTVISVDARGMIEYWAPRPDSAFQPPAGTTAFDSKLDTDLFDLAKAKTAPTSTAISQDGKQFVVTSLDRKIRLFKLGSGKLSRVYSDALAVYEEEQASGTLDLDPMDFGRRQAVEKDLDETAATTLQEFLAPPSSAAAGPLPVAAAAASKERDHVYRPPPSNAIFDETGVFLMYPTLIGIKVVNTVSNRVCAVLGRVENTERFIGLALYQGVPTMSSQMALARGLASSSEPMSSTTSSQRKVDPTLVCCSFKRQRFFLFSKRDPADDDSGAAAEGRDVQNEPPSARDMAVAQQAAQAVKRAKMGNSAVIHTTKGDITCSLLPDVTPLAVENFCELSRRGYYDNTTWHRVIKGFMIQVGVPGDADDWARLDWHSRNSATAALPCLATAHLCLLPRLCRVVPRP